MEQVADQLAEVDRSAAAALVQAVTEADGVGPLSEDGRLAIAHGRAGSMHAIWRDEDDRSIVGYLYLSPADEHSDRTAELCVAPGSRRHGIGSALLEAAL